MAAEKGKDKGRDKMKKAKGERFWRRVLPLALVVLTLIIWGHSLMSQAASSAVSKAVEEVVFSKPESAEKFVDQTQGWTKHLTSTHLPWTPSFFIRKGAHLLEFGALGAVWFACGKVYERRWLWLCGLPTAVVDECLQWLVGRGAMVTDVVIDVMGFLGGTALAALTVWVWCKKKKIK